MVSSKSLSLLWFMIKKFDDVTSSNQLRYKICSELFNVFENSNGRIMDKYS